MSARCPNCDKPIATMHDFHARDEFDSQVCWRSFDDDDRCTAPAIDWRARCLEEQAKREAAEKERDAACELAESTERRALDLLAPFEKVQNERDAAIARAERAEGELEAFREIRDRIVNHWWPLLGYACANELAYPALGDKRATVAPLIAERDALEAERDQERCRAEGAERDLAGKYYEHSRDLVELREARAELAEAKAELESLSRGFSDMNECCVTLEHERAAHEGCLALFAVGYAVAMALDDRMALGAEIHDLNVENARLYDANEELQEEWRAEQMSRARDVQRLEVENVRLTAACAAMREALSMVRRGEHRGGCMSCAWPECVVTVAIATDAGRSLLEEHELMRRVVEAARTVLDEDEEDLTPGSTMSARQRVLKAALADLDAMKGRT